MSAQDRGWGPGWPDCPRDRIVTVLLSTGARLPVHVGIAHLVGSLAESTINQGYRIREEDTWGFACRAIRGTDRPSNHSWGLAVDINARSNPYRSDNVLQTDMPDWMPALWRRYGFRWGGDYRTIKDAMHYEFMGTPQDAARYTKELTVALVTVYGKGKDRDLADAVATYLERASATDNAEHARKLRDAGQTIVCVGGPACDEFGGAGVGIEKRQGVVYVRGTDRWDTLHRTSQVHRHV